MTFSKDKLAAIDCITNHNVYGRRNKIGVLRYWCRGHTRYIKYNPIARLIASGVVAHSYQGDRLVLTPWGKVLLEA